MAVEGLRTLVLSQRRLEREEFLIWKEKYELAKNLIDGRAQQMEELQDELEINLSIVGATAIEDKLQEQVPETILQLKKAGIKVWVLTGDKIETAKTIGFSCALLTEDMKLFELYPKNKDLLDSMMDEAIREIRSDSTKGQKKLRGLVVSGDALIEIMKDKHHHSLPKKVGVNDQLNYIANRCEAVLCCRVSPKQKQQIVKMVKKAHPHIRTLAIGDGANDVNMITEAHIGVGIKGVEGQQAAKASDFAITEFKALRRLLFVYGRESYRKNSVMVLFNFYKNALMVMPQLFHAVLTENASGILIFTDILYQLINPVFTAVQIGFYATFDRDCDYRQLELSHEFYPPGISKLFFNTPIFFRWLLFGSLQGCLLAAFAYY